MTRPNTFYVYAHLIPGSDRVFYIGKGSWSPKKAYGRASSSENRNVIWQRTTRKHGGFDVAVLAEFFSEADAFDYESKLIAIYGRKDRGGVLANLTDGGEGAIGRHVAHESIAKRVKTMQARQYPQRTSPMKGRAHTPEAKAAISRAVAGDKHPLFGSKRSSETIAKMSVGIRANHPRARRVIDKATGVIYLSAREAARQLGLNPSTLKHWLSGRYTNKSDLEFA